MFNMAPPEAFGPNVQLWSEAEMEQITNAMRLSRAVYVFLTFF